MNFDRYTIVCLWIVWHAGSLAATPQAPREFNCTATTNIAWNSTLEYFYSSEFRALLRLVEISMDKVFGEAAKYYSTIVSGLWQVDGTVGLGFRVFYAAESKVTKEVVNETLRNARSTALMKFTLDDIVITDVFPKSSSTSARKLPLDFWEIALILGALLVLTLFTVIVLLTIQTQRLKDVPRQHDPWSHTRGLGFVNPFTRSKTASFNLPHTLYNLNSAKPMRGQTTALKTFSNEDLRELDFS